MLIEPLEWLLSFSTNLIISQDLQMLLRIEEKTLQFISQSTQSLKSRTKSLEDIAYLHILTASPDFSKNID